MWWCRLYHDARATVIALALALTLAGPVQGAAGQVPAVIQVSGATHVEVDQDAGLWRLRGEPVVVSRGAVVVRAPDVRYDSRLLIIHAAGGVTFTDGTTSMRSAEATVWLREERATAISEVEAVYRDDGATTRIRAARVDVWTRDRRAAASGGVVLSRGEVTLSGETVDYQHGDRRGLVGGEAKLSASDGTLTADRIDARLATDEFSASGGVRLARVDLVAHAAEALLRRRDAVAVLTGGVVVRTPRGEMSAQTITIDLAHQRLQASGQVHLVVRPAR